MQSSCFVVTTLQLIIRWYICLLHWTFFFFLITVPNDFCNSSLRKSIIEKVDSRFFFFFQILRIILAWWYFGTSYRIFLTSIRTTSSFAFFFSSFFSFFFFFFVDRFFLGQHSHGVDRMVRMINWSSCYVNSYARIPQDRDSYATTRSTNLIHRLSLWHHVESIVSTEYQSSSITWYFIPFALAFG